MQVGNEESELVAGDGVRVVREFRVADEDIRPVHSKVG